MRRWVIATAVLVTALSSPLPSWAQQFDEARIQEEARPIARQYGAMKYYLQRAEPAQANRYAHCMLLSLKLVEQQIGGKGADAVFYVATGMKNRAEFFNSIDAADANGELFNTDGPCAYYWQQARDGRPCGERATHPN